MVASYGFYLYGSTARGEGSQHSDQDLLLVLESQRDHAHLIRELLEDLGTDAKRPDVSLYSLRRLNEMYRRGHLFAWHLYKEATFLGKGEDLLATLGRPAEYRTFTSDVTGLIKLLNSANAAIGDAPENVIYEAGIVYVSVRNVAMSASYYSPNGLTFSVEAPFCLGYGDNEVPISRERFRMFRQARLASTRGVNPPLIEADSLKRDVSKLEVWADRELWRIDRRAAE